MPGLGGADEHVRPQLWVDDLSDAQEIAIWVDDCELAKAPRLIFKAVHSRDASMRQRTRRERTVDALDIHDTDVATGR